LYLEPTGVVVGGPGFEFAPGEGLAGAVFSTGRPMLWPTAIDVSMAQASLGEANRQHLREIGIRVTRSAIAVPLRPSAGGVIGAIELSSVSRENAWSAADLDVMEALAGEAARAIERARGHEADVDQALLDSVTGLVSHRQMLNVIEKEVARAARSGEPVAVIFSDLDAFKEINDVWGHDAGNRVLMIYANVLRSILRREDTAARYGGDEFVCVLPGADHVQARTIAERMRLRFEISVAANQVIGSAATVSCGIAVYPLDASSAEQLLAAADADLLRAKQRRSQVLTGRARARIVEEAPPSH
jgi:diguanylate cyclase (GGDEF)-like protein